MAMTDVLEQSDADLPLTDDERRQRAALKVLQTYHPGVDDVMIDTAAAYFGVDPKALAQRFRDGSRVEPYGYPRAWSASDAVSNRAGAPYGDSWVQETAEGDSDAARSDLSREKPIGSPSSNVSSGFWDAAGQYARMRAEAIGRLPAEAARLSEATGFSNYLRNSVEALSRMPSGLARMREDLVTDPLLFLRRAAPGLAGLGMATFSSIPRAVPAWRYTEPGEVAIRYESKLLPTRVTPGRGLKPDNLCSTR